MLKMTKNIVMAAGFLFWSCAGENQRSAMTQGLVVPDSLKWPGGVIPVCWSAPGNEAGKKFIENTLTTEIEFRSNLRFTGWDELCPGPAPSNKLQIIVDDTVPNANQGYGGPKQAHVMHLNFDFKDSAFWWTCQSEQGKRACNQNIALHEVMHAAGVVHEQERSDSACSYHKGFPAQGQREVGAFDNKSIMNACNPDYYNVAMSLSQGDIARNKS